MDCIMSNAMLVPNILALVVGNNKRGPANKMKAAGSKAQSLKQVGEFRQQEGKIRTIKYQSVLYYWTVWLWILLKLYASK